MKFSVHSLVEDQSVPWHMNVVLRLLHTDGAIASEVKR